MPNANFSYGWPCQAINGSYSNFTLDAADDAMEFLFQVPPELHGQALTRAWLRQGSVTGTAPTYRYSLQGVDGTGRADGTIKGAGNAAFIDITPVAGGNNTAVWHTLGASHTMTAGERLALRLARQSGTIDGSNFCTFSAGLLNSLAKAFPIAITVNGGSASKGSLVPTFGYGTAMAGYGLPMAQITSLAFASNSTPDEHATRFIVPTSMCGSFKVKGVRVSGGTWTAGHTVKFQFYTGTTVLQDVTVDTDDVSAGTRDMEFFFDETTLATGTAGQVYRVGMAPQTTTNQGLSCIDVLANADLTAFPGGVECYASTRTDAGAWTDVTTRRLFLEPIFSDITPPLNTFRSALID